MPVVAPPPPSFVSGLLQKIKGQYTQGENETRHCEPAVPAVIVVGLVEGVPVAIASVHLITPLRAILRHSVA